MRILITGGPRTGKTTLANLFNVLVTHTDEVKDLEWSEQSEEVSNWFDEDAPWVIEGMTVVRALRKWLRKHDEDMEKPADILIYMSTPHEELSDAQKVATKGLETVLDEIVEELWRRGVDVIGF